MLVRSSSDAGEIEQGEREMLYKVFDFADKEVHEVMVPRPEVVAISVDLPPEEALAALLESPYHALPRLPRVARRDHRGPPRARSLLGAARPRDRAGGDRAASAAGLHRSGDEGSRRAPRRVPQAEPAHGGRRRRVRRHAGDRHARGPARGDRRRDRGRVRPARTSRSSGSTTPTSGSTARSRSTTSTSSSGPRSRSRTTTRWPGWSSARSAVRPRSATR